MEAFQLTAAGRPLLEEGEVEVLSVEGVQLERGPHRRQASAVVTSRRAVFVCEDKPGAIAFGLERVLSAEPVAARGFFGRGDALLNVQLEGPAAHGEYPGALVSLSFRSAALRDKFRAQLEEGRRRLRLEAEAARRGEAERLAEQGFATSRAGVAGIIRAQGCEHAALSRTLDAAFSDLDSLMADARRVAELAQALASRQGGAAARGGAEQPQLDELERSRLFGISSPVTRESHGAAFARELCRQLSDFLEAPLRRGAGVLSLTDAYCMFNRARGSALVSPADLLQACALLPELGLPLELLSLRGGVLVLRQLRPGGESLEAAIERLACRRDGLSAVELGLGTGLSLLLAGEFLLTLEQRGRLCRDGKRRDSLAFYPNFMAADSAQAGAALEALLKS